MQAIPRRRDTLPGLPQALMRRLGPAGVALTAVEGDTAPCLVCDAAARVQGRNPAATRMLAAGGTAAEALRIRFAESGRVQDAILAGLADAGAARWEGAEAVLEARRLRGGLALWRITSRGALPDEDALDVLPVAAMRIGRDGRVRAINAPARALLGPEAAGGASVADLLTGLGRDVGEWLRAALDGTGSLRPEVLRARAAPIETHVQVTLAPDPASSAGLVAVLQDATELKTLEAQFVQSQKMQAIGQLAGGVAHDFNNLLTAISGHCDLLMHRRDRADPDYADLTEIAHNTNRAAALVGQLLAFSRKQAQRLESVDLRDCLQDMMQLLNRLVGEKVWLEVAHDPALTGVTGDRRQMEQVFLNLVVNARDAMGPEGGEIRIETKNVVLDRPMKRERVAVPAGRYVVVSVSDDGPGVPPEIAAKVFEPFFTTKRAGEGTGLGLSTAYGIVKQTGGYIFLDPAADCGALFTLWFPAADPAHRAAQAVAPLLAIGTAPRAECPPPMPHEAPAPGPDAAVPEPPPADGAPPTVGRRILLVEDEDPVRAFASRALRLRGYTVIEAASGEEALAALGEASEPFDLFVTDVIMPGLDGPSWVREGIALKGEVPVIFVSGYAEGALDGVHDTVPDAMFLPKPFSLAALNEATESLLAAAARRA